MKEFIVSNYVLILSIILVSVITLIGYFVDRSRSNKKEVVMTKEKNPIMDNNILKTNNNINNTNNVNINNSFDINQSINNLKNNSNNSYNQNG